MTMTTHANDRTAGPARSQPKVMAKRRYRKNQGLMELAAMSDWKYGATLAGACVLGAVVIIPVFFAGSSVLHGLAGVFSMFAWLMAFIFGAITLVRFLKQQSDAIGTKSASPNLRVVAEPSHRRGASGDARPIRDATES